MKSLVPVIGMHRSGTSAVAGVLSRLGVDFGPTAQLMPPSPANPRGYFENLVVVRIHEELLKALGCSWRDPRLRGDWWMTRDAGAALHQVWAWIEGLQGDGPHGVKDPRMCLLRYLWSAATDYEGIRLKPIFVVRDQAAVEASLRQRDGLGAAQVRVLLEKYGAGMTAWARNTHAPREAIIQFEDLVARPDEAVRGIAAVLDLKPTRVQLAEAEAFVDGGLVHHG